MCLLKYDEIVFRRKPLETMPSLISLAVARNKNYNALPKWFWKLGGFPQLHFFRISKFENLEELSKTEGVMPHLEKLYVDSRLNLMRVPVGLELLNFLKYCFFH